MNQQNKQPTPIEEIEEMFDEYMCLGCDYIGNLEGMREHILSTKMEHGIAFNYNHKNVAARIVDEIIPKVLKEILSDFPNSGTNSERYDTGSWTINHKVVAVIEDDLKQKANEKFNIDL